MEDVLNGRQAKKKILRGCEGPGGNRSHPRGSDVERDRTGLRCSPCSANEMEEVGAGMSATPFFSTEGGIG
jgi:hypothetical protein